MNTEKVKIRPYTPDDYPAVTALWQEASLPYKPRGRDRAEKIAAEIQKDTAIFLVAESDGRIIGSVFGTHDGRKGWINRLAVAPTHRRQGIAAKLVRAVEKRLEALGIEIVACLIEEWNHLSMEVFQRLGYQPHRDIIYFTKRKSPET